MTWVYSCDCGYQTRFALVGVAREKYPEGGESSIRGCSRCLGANADDPDQDEQDQDEQDDDDDGPCTGHDTYIPESAKGVILGWTHRTQRDRRDRSRGGSRQPRASA